MGKTFTVPLNQIRMAPELQDTNLILFPLDMMQDFHLSVGMGIRLRLSEEKTIFLTVGIPVGNDTHVAVVNLDPTYQFIRGLEGVNSVTFESLDTHTHFPSHRTVLLLNKEDGLRKVVDWLDSRPAVNTNVVYAVNEELKCMFVTVVEETLPPTEFTEAEGDAPVSPEFQGTITAVVPVFDTYYITDDFQQWWKVQALHLQEHHLRRELRQLTVEIDRTRRAIQRYREQMKKLRDRCRLEFALAQAFLDLEKLDYVVTAQRIQNLSDILKRLKKKTIKIFFSSSGQETPQVVIEQFTEVQEALEKAERLLNTPLEVATYEESRLATFTAKYGQPPPHVKHLEEYHDTLVRRVQEINGEVTQLRERLKEIQQQAKEWGDLYGELTNVVQSLGEKKEEVKGRIEQQIQSILRIPLPPSNFLLKRLRTWQESLKELSSALEEEKVRQLNQHLWNEFQQITSGLRALEEEEMKKSDQERPEFEL
ncbi:MAG: hypothetical protein D6732_18970 [Methanobacteriota archaeon]|nr:MAG: hypothetical protein D6732_18970 [Euryarchaeota archaeon]